MTLPIWQAARITLSRRRWLVAACVGVAALAPAGWWMWPAERNPQLLPGRYDRIGLGMAPADVESVMGRQPLSLVTLDASASGSAWELVEEEKEENSRSMELWLPDRQDVWCDGKVLVNVTYSRGHAVDKQLVRQMPEWKRKARAWLAWLRGLVGL